MDLDCTRLRAINNINVVDTFSGNTWWRTHTFLSRQIVQYRYKIVQYVMTNLVFYLCVLFLFLFFLSESTLSSNSFYPISGTGSTYKRSYLHLPHTLPLSQQTLQDQSLTTPLCVFFVFFCLFNKLKLCLKKTPFLLSSCYIFFRRERAHMRKTTQVGERQKRKIVIYKETFCCQGNNPSLTWILSHSSIWSHLPAWVTIQMTGWRVPCWMNI